jgi:hypothetical protein
MDSDQPRDHSRRELIMQLGGPIFVPAGVWSSLWKISGSGRSNGIPNKVSVSAYDHARNTQLHVKTSLTDQYRQESGLVAILFAEGVPHDVELPYTATVTEHPVSLVLDSERKIDLRRFVLGDNWIAFGLVSGRRLEVRARSVPPEEVMLEEVKDPSLIHESRWT